MSGILGSEKRTSYRILSEEFPEKLLWECLCRLNSFLSEDLEAKLKTYNSADNTLQDHFHTRSPKKPIRQYFLYEGKVFSIYESLRQTNVTLQYAVFLMSNLEFALAIINNGEIIKKAVFDSSIQDGKISSRRSAEQLFSYIRTLLSTWKDDLHPVQVFYIHCPARHEEFMTEEIKKVRGPKLGCNDIFQKVPFVVNGVTTEELIRVWDKLFRVVEHGSTQSFIRALETGQMQTIVDNTENSEQTSIIESTKQQRRDEKQRWPGITPQKKIELNEALMSNQYEKLQDLVENNLEIIDYLTTTHEKLEGKTYMHYATKENLIESVEFLLNIGCDSSLSDDTGKVPYDYAKTIEMKQTFVDFRIENAEGRQWKKSHIPEEVEVPSPPKSSKSNKKTADKPKPKVVSGKSKKNQKYVDMMDDDFDYDDYDYEEDIEEEKPAPSTKIRNFKHYEETKEVEHDESDTETKFKTHSLLEDEWRTAENAYRRPYYTDIPLKSIGHAKIECQKLKKFLESRLQASVRTYFTSNEVLYSGYRAILSGHFTPKNGAVKANAVILINDEYFAGTAYDNGKACRSKTLYRNSANWTKIREFTRDNLFHDRFMDLKLSNCIQNVLNCWAEDAEITVLYSCPPQFEWFLQECILEFRHNANFECIPFAVKNYTIPAIDRIWKKMTTLTEHGQLSTFDKAVEEKDYETMDNMLEDVTEILLPSHTDIRRNGWISATQRREIHKAIMKNNCKLMESVAGESYYMIDYLGRPHAKFGGQTFLEVATKENLNQIVKYLSERWWYR